MKKERDLFIVYELKMLHPDPGGKLHFHVVPFKCLNTFKYSKGERHIRIVVDGVRCSDTDSLCSLARLVSILSPVKICGALH